MNVLVYNGNGASLGSVKHTVDTLRIFLEPFYSVATITAKGLQSEPWISKTAAIVFPGGADLPYVKEGKHFVPKIKRFIQNGGIYIGFCAGGYFGSSRVEFAQGDPNLEVIGNRDLGFFKGISRGPAFPGFQYNSEDGSKAVQLKLRDGSTFRTYFNGGPVFVDADKAKDVDILASYTEPTNVASSDYPDNSASSAAAVILCNVGKGKALLTGPHPEFIPELLHKTKDEHFAKTIVPILLENEQHRLRFMEEILRATGLSCNEDACNRKIPNLTPILVTTQKEKHCLIEELSDNLNKYANNIEYVSDNHITLNSGTDLMHIFTGINDNFNNASIVSFDLTPECNKKVFIFESQNESSFDKSLTPYFNIEKYFESLKTKTLGNILMYGTVVSSTSTMLNVNRALLRSLPKNSTVHVGAIQTSGVGRGGNSWVNPIGVSASTVAINFPIASLNNKNNATSIVFVQYLAMLAYCEAIFSYGSGYEDLPVRIKWPNDLYILKPEYYQANNMKLVSKGLIENLAPLTDIEPAYIKVSGLLVNTNIIDNEYSLLLGCGINVNNEKPSTSLNRWVAILNEERISMGMNLLQHIEIEKLLALYLNKIEYLLENYISYGPKTILPLYYKYWLHTNQIVTLPAYNNTRVMITGITEDYGLLLGKELMSGSDEYFTGNTIQLQPDGNTFDIFKGLISTKVSS